VTAQRKRSRWRGLARGSLIAIALVVVGWQVAKRAIDVDQYRSRVESALADFTGLPVAIGSIELSWRTAPFLSAYEVSIGAGDFHARAARLDIFPLLWPLVRSRVEISRIELVEPAVTLPRDRADLQARWEGLLAHIEAARGEPRPGEPSPGMQFRIDELFAESALLRFGQDDAHTIVTSISVAGIGADEIELTLEADVPTTGAHAEGALRIPAQPGGEVEGDLAITGVQPHAFAELPEIAHADWQAQAQIGGKRGEELELSIEGSIEPITEHALGGRFTGHATIAADGKVDAELELGGEDLELSATARLLDPEHSHVRVKRLSARGQALDALLGEVVRDPITLGAARDAALDLRDFELSLGGTRRIASGVLKANGIEVDYRDATIARNLALDVRAAEGVFRIAELRGGPIDLRGAITPGSAERRGVVDLTGTVALDAALVRALGAPEWIKEARGAISIEQLRAELPGVAPAGVAYALRAQVLDGFVRLENETIGETLSPIELAAVGDSTTLRFTAHALGEALGHVAANGSVDAGHLTGTLSLADPNASFVRNEKTRARVAPLLRAYSGAPFAFEVKSEEGPPRLRRIRIERTEAPQLNAALVLRDDPPGDPLRDLDVAADLPAEFVVELLPNESRVSGTGTLRIRRSEGGAGFFAEADLADLGLAVGPYLEKKVGEPIRVRVEGEVAESHWLARKLVLAGEEASFSLPITEEGISAQGVEIDLAPFAFLLADGGRAAGRVRLNLDTATRAVAVQLLDVLLWVTPELGVDEANGEIAVADHDWALHGLRVRGSGSHATLDLAVKDHVLTGALRGARVDAEFVKAILDEERALNPPDETPGTPVTGELAIALDRVTYRRAETQQFRAKVKFAEHEIHVRDLDVEVGEGRVTGRVDVRTRRPEPPLLDLDLDFSGVSRQFVDGLLGEESRGKPGRYTGKLVYTAPLRSTVREMMPDASGSLVGVGHDGTLIGRLGLATKIITVLRSTEALRMQMPAFQDEGLVFDTLDADLALKDGKLEVRKLQLDSTSYAMSASGSVDFRQDTAHVPIEVNAIRGITSLIERVPVAGDALKIVNVRVVATGSPWDMQLSVASIQDQLIGAGLAGPRAVIKGVRDVLDLMRSAGSTSAPVPDAGALPPVEPSPAPVGPGPGTAPAPELPPDPA
jgi:hypothetical protein